MTTTVNAGSTTQVASGQVVAAHSNQIVYFDTDKLVDSLAFHFNTTDTNNGDHVDLYQSLDGTDFTLVGSVGDNVGQLVGSNNGGLAIESVLAQHFAVNLVRATAASTSSTFNVWVLPKSAGINVTVTVS